MNVVFCVRDYYWLLIDWFSGDVLDSMPHIFIDTKQMRNGKKIRLTITSKSVCIENDFKMVSKFQREEKRDEMAKNLKNTKINLNIYTRNNGQHTKNRFQFDDLHVAIIILVVVLFYFSSFKFQL